MSLGRSQNQPPHPGFGWRVEQHLNKRNDHNLGKNHGTFVDELSAVDVESDALMVPSLPVMEGQVAPVKVDKRPPDLFWLVTLAVSSTLTAPCESSQLLETAESSEADPGQGLSSAAMVAGGWIRGMI